MPTVGGDSPYEGTIFGGLKFFVSRQVALRNQFIEKLKTNGAKVVQLEKFADVIIGDDSNRIVIPNSVSCKYIDKCIAEGDLVDIEEFRLSNANKPRPVGSKQPTKGARTKFTPEDDQILVSWVRRYQGMGASISGNEIYKELAKQYPNHTWQSWQARWVKTLAFRREEDLPKPVDLPPPKEPSPTAQVLSVTQKSPPAPTQGTRMRVPFTAEDDKLIFEYVQERMQRGARVSGNIIYKEFEEQHPHHTAQSWRARYVKYLANRDPISFAKQHNDHKPPPKPRQSRPAAAGTSTFPQTLPLTSRTNRAATPKQPASTAPKRKSSTPSASTPGESRADRLRKIQSAKKVQRAWSRYKLRRRLAQGHAARIIQRAWGRYTFRRTITRRLAALVEEAANAPLEFPLLKLEQDGDGIHFSFAGEDEGVMELGPRRAFPASEKALRMFLRLVNKEKEVVEEVQVEGKKVNLFELWRVVVEESEAGMDWVKVIERLGFLSGDVLDVEKVSGELKGAFGRYGLLEAWEAMCLFEERVWEGVELGGSV
ncbi:Rap1 Myb domain-containing protein [Podospora fimiseda]|uniref:DNA-binding protein RAP1 n=1 Tax=Podospora fimiseda TaxID=252190 RepID=A0AAN7BZS2_9PEZI|nr:Rap1 Myb domain-containing protein [Podospora fimiseda]